MNSFAHLSTILYTQQLWTHLATLILREHIFLSKKSSNSDWLPCILVQADFYMFDILNFTYIVTHHTAYTQSYRRLTLLHTTLLIHTTQYYRRFTLLHTTLLIHTTQYYRRLTLLHTTLLIHTTQITHHTIFITHYLSTVYNLKPLYIWGQLYKSLVNFNYS